MQRIMRRTLIAALTLLWLGSVTARQASAETLFALSGQTVTSQAPTLLSFDSAAPGTINAALPITGLASNDRIVGMDFRPATGELYALARGVIGLQSRLYTLDTTTGAATFVAQLGTQVPLIEGAGLDINPVEDYLRLVSVPGHSSIPRNLQVNLDTGQFTAGGTPRYAPGDPNAGATLMFIRLAGLAYTDNFAGASQATAYAIDSFRGVLVRLEPESAGTLHTVGPLGIGIDAFAGFDISGVTGTAYAAFAPRTGPDVGIAQLYTLDLSTGAATHVGRIGDGTAPRGSIFGLAARVGAPIPEPTSLLLLCTGLAGAGAAAVRRRRRAGTSAGA